MILGKNLKEIRKQKKLSLNDLSEKVDCTISYLSRIERGLHEKIPYQTAKKLADALDTTPQALFDDRQPNNALKFKGLQNFAPLLKWNEVEGWLNHGEKMEQKRVIEYSPISSALKGNCFFVEITNDKMESKEIVTFNKGDHVLVEPCNDAENGKIVVCKLKNDNEPILRKIIKEGGKVSLMPLNDRYQIEHITEFNNVEILGVVVERRIMVP